MRTMISTGTLALATMMFAAGCSQATQVEGGSMAGQQSNSGTAVAAPKAAVSADTHTHPANECTNSIEHTHPNGAGAHKHHYSCNPNASKMAAAPKMEKRADEHQHPANRCTRSISHAHPNGLNAHAHRYSCKNNGGNMGASMNKANPNTHTHPANSLTNSQTHTHPNGARVHSHHYGN